MNTYKMMSIKYLEQLDDKDDSKLRIIYLLLKLLNED